MAPDSEPKDDNTRTSSSEPPSPSPSASSTDESQVNRASPLHVVDQVVPVRGDSPPRISDWRPPPEPLRPEIPYRHGMRFRIFQHQPGPPFGGAYGECPPDVRFLVPREELREMTLVDLCTLYPPRPGIDDDDVRHELQITGEIAVRDTGAQIVVCRLDDRPQQYVAKIFDPLYYKFNDNQFGFVPQDTCLIADKDCANETAAYLELCDSPLAGDGIPSYYGTWTFDIPLELPDGTIWREVRLVLMEHVEGARATLGLDSTLFSEATRLSIMKRVIEIDAEMVMSGVLHMDLYQRNVLITHGSTPTQVSQEDGGRVLIIDHNHSWVTRIRHEMVEKYREDENGNMTWWEELRLPEFGPDLPVHPARRCRGAFLFFNEFDNWFPADWRGDDSLKAFNDWLDTLWRDSPYWENIREILDPIARLEIAEMELEAKEIREKADATELEAKELTAKAEAMELKAKAETKERKAKQLKARTGSRTEARELKAKAEEKELEAERLKEKAEVQERQLKARKAKEPPYHFPKAV